MGLIGFRWPGSKYALPESRVVVSCPWTTAGSSLYIHRLMPGGLQNPEAGSYMCPAWFLPFPILEIKLHISWRFMSMGHNPPLGSGPLSLCSKAPHSLSSWASIWMIHYRYNPAPPGRFILSSYIPNIRPRIDLNLFMSIFNTLEKLLLQYLRVNLVIRHDVIFQDYNKLPWRHLFIKKPYIPYFY